MYLYMYVYSTLYRYIPSIGFVRGALRRDFSFASVLDEFGQAWHSDAQALSPVACALAVLPVMDVKLSCKIGWDSVNMAYNTWYYPSLIWLYMVYYILYMFRFTSYSDPKLPEPIIKMLFLVEQGMLRPLKGTLFLPLLSYCVLAQMRPLFPARLQIDCVRPFMQPLSPIKCTAHIFFHHTARDLYVRCIL